MSEVDKVTEKTIREGGVLALLYFDMHGNSKEGLQQLGVAFIQKMLKEQGVVYARGQIDEPLEEEKLFSTSIEIRMLAKSYMDLLRVCGTYSPFSVEILEPMDFKLSMDQLHDSLMYVSTLSHDYKRYIFEKTSSQEDYLKYKKHINNKIKLGKMLMDKKKKS